MTLFEEIETSFSDAIGLDFIATTDYVKEPSIMLLVFIDPKKVSDIYNRMVNTFDHYQLTAIIKTNNTGATLEIVDRDTADIVIIKDLPYIKNNLKYFIEATPKDGRFLFAIGVIDENKMTQLYNTMYPAARKFLAFAGYSFVSSLSS
jgi:hypothetical protein